MEAVVHILALLLGLSALFGWINYKFLNLPPTIGLVVIALAASFGVLVLDALVPAWGLEQRVRELLLDIDFADTLMEGLLSFLLFAGALHVDLSDLRQRRWAITLMATIGVLLSAALIGGGIYLVFRAVGLAIPLTHCLVFGALISPTDPVAVLGILKHVRVPTGLQAKIAGESLFNDGVGVVLFTILAAIAFGRHGEELSAGGIVTLFLAEAFGGAALGLATGYVAFLALRAVDEHNLEVLITLALVTVTYSAAGALHVSGPIAVVVAGLLIGNQGTRLAMSENTARHVTEFWALIDEILNSVLFLLIGFEVELLAVVVQPSYVAAALLAIPLVLAARFVAVSVPISLLRLGREYTPGTVRVLTWGGLRGGISVALALSLPESASRDVILTVTYAVVIFSIVVQGLTIERLVRRVVPGDVGADVPAAAH